ncbi:MAG: SPOR domain-containing protein [Saprospiraceae bacterium]|nr:SPOR domain-containing protein [Saprospiraceae bacterium]MDW8483230.1 SPOR domain-containing protein [Saprospiraceae bacterium]
MDKARILTYIVSLLVAGLVLTAVYKIYTAKSRQSQLAQEAQEFDQQRHLGYVDPDSTGTLFTGDTSVIVGSEEAEAPASPSLDNPPSAPPPTQPSPLAEKPTAPPTAPPQPTASPLPESSVDLDNDTHDGRYRVVAGSFTKLEGARREMQRLIKMGYTDAEIGYYNRGKYAAVVVKRTNSLAEANRIVDDLERRGIDASVIDKFRKN